MGVEEINIPREIESDGYVTREQDLQSRPLERVTDTTANPTSECCYPRCEECRHYEQFGGATYCTVPMVITKQIYRITEDKLRKMEEKIANLEKAVYDHILGDDYDGDEWLPVVEWDDEYGHQRFPLTEELLTQYKEYAKTGVIHNVTVVGRVRRSDIP